MFDITKPKERPSFDKKEYLKCFLIALLPALVVSELLREAGIVGVLPTLIPIFGGAEIVKIIRKRLRSKIAKN